MLNLSETIQLPTIWYQFFYNRFSNRRVNHRNRHSPNTNFLPFSITPVAENAESSLCSQFHHNTKGPYAVYICGNIDNDSIDMLSTKGQTDLFVCLVLVHASIHCMSFNFPHLHPGCLHPLYVFQLFPSPSWMLASTVCLSTSPISILDACIHFYQVHL